MERGRKKQKRNENISGPNDSIVALAVLANNPGVVRIVWPVPVPSVFWGLPFGRATPSVRVTIATAATPSNGPLTE